MTNIASHSNLNPTTYWDHLRKPERGQPRRKPRPKLTKAMIAACVSRAYEARRDRLIHPEGSFDRAGRWYPSETEDADGDGSSVRSPSRAWPYSYLLRCRTRQHVRCLVERALAGLQVPSDIAHEVTEMNELLAQACTAWEDRDDDSVAQFVERLLQKSRRAVVCPKGLWHHLCAEPGVH